MVGLGVTQGQIKSEEEVKEEEEAKPISAPAIKRELTVKVCSLFNNLTINKCTHF